MGKNIKKPHFLDINFNEKTCDGYNSLWIDSENTNNTVKTHIHWYNEDILRLEGSDKES